MIGMKEITPKEAASELSQIWGLSTEVVMAIPELQVWRTVNGKLNVKFPSEPMQSARICREALNAALPVFFYMLEKEVNKAHAGSPVGREKSKFPSLLSLTAEQREAYRALTAREVQDPKKMDTNNFAWVWSLPNGSVFRVSFRSGFQAEKLEWQDLAVLADHIRNVTLNER